MYRSFGSKFSRLCCSTLSGTLASFWICGLLFGIFVGMYAIEDISVIGHFSVCYGELTLFPLLLFRLLPLFVCFASFRFSKPFVLFFVVFFRGLFFTLTAVYLLSAFGASAWLFSSLMLIGDAFVISVYWFVIFRSLDYRFQMQTVLVAMTAIFFVSLLDYLHIAPFTANLI